MSSECVYARETESTYRKEQGTGGVVEEEVRKEGGEASERGVGTLYPVSPLKHSRSPKLLIISCRCYFAGVLSLRTCQN